MKIEWYTFLLNFQNLILTSNF